MKELHIVAMLPNVQLVQIGEDGGSFFVRLDNTWDWDLRVVASNGMGWDHVSVSRIDRIPTWEEMEFVKRLFFEDNEIAMQLHVPASDHINIHPYCLHLWRPQNKEIPMPHRIQV
jgi:hypothetical protein